MQFLKAGEADKKLFTALCLDWRDAPWVCKACMLTSDMKNASGIEKVQTDGKNPILFHVVSGI